MAFDLDKFFDLGIELDIKHSDAGTYYRNKISRQERFRRRAYAKNSWSSVDIATLSRKEKLALIGRKSNKSDIRKRLSKVKVYFTDNYNNGAYISDTFCPKCGCGLTNSTGNMASYPEIYQNDTCMRCGFPMGGADNSPYMSYLEGECDEDIAFYKSLGVQYIDCADTQDDKEFKDMFK